MNLSTRSDRTLQKNLKTLVLFILVVAVITLKMTGVSDKVEIETIRSYIQGFGHLGPVIYIFIVTLAPAFMLPGSPFIIAGGVLFGSFWGVIYGITGATTGACLAFLVSRYLLRDWVESKLTSPAWIKLINQTEIHGWKIVAITRLVPLVPFNLLSYALGITRIKFLQYAVTSFICMLPGCIGYILISDSILDLFKGKITMELAVGVVIIVTLSLSVFWLRKKY